MKKLLLALSAIMVLICTSCNSEPQGVKNPFVGEWRLDGSTDNTWTNMVFYKEMNGFRESQVTINGSPVQDRINYTYTYNEKSVTITSNVDISEIEYTISGNKLTLTYTRPEGKVTERFTKKQ